jgi:hypothetical protein
MNPGIVVAVCEYCNTTLYRDGPVLHAGERSILAEPRSSLRVGAIGDVGGRRMELLGRIQFSTVEGDAAWDEWYAEDPATGEAIWLIEDARGYTLERPLGPVELPPDFQPTIGRMIEHQGQGFEITEVGDAVCVGGEGRLGRDLRPGATYRFVDSRQLGSSGVLNLEFSPGALAGGAPLGFYGEVVPASAVHFAAPEAGGFVEAQTTSAIQCVGCGAGFQLKAQGDPVRTTTCDNCGSQLELSAGGQRVLSRNSGRAIFPFAVGDAMTWKDDRWEVVGRLVYVETDEYGVQYFSREYLLWSVNGGYLWLAEYEGHYVVFTPTKAGPPLREIRASSRFDTLDFDGPFRFFERGAQVVHFVDGALPWLTRVGDRHEYVDLIAPPRILSVELSGTREQERFVGEYAPATDIHAAFGKDGPRDVPQGVHAAQPSPIGPAHAFASWTSVAFVALNLILAFTAGPKTLLHQVDIPAHAQPVQLRGDTVFEIPTAGSIVGLHISTTSSRGRIDVDAELGTALTGSEFPSTPRPAVDLPRGRVIKRYLRAEEAGTHVLSLRVESEPPRDVHIALTIGDRSGRPPFWLAMLLLIYPGWCLFRHQRHESRRWSGEDG